MNNLMEKLKTKMARFMYGRNGMDELGRDIYIVSIVIAVVELFARTGVLSVIALAGFIYSVFRTYSKKIFARQMENEKYLSFRRKLEGKRHLQKRKWDDRKTFRYYTCKSCGQTVRVPKGKGKIEIRCPKCGATFVKKT